MITSLGVIGRQGCTIVPLALSHVCRESSSFVYLVNTTAVYTIHLCNKASFTYQLKLIVLLSPTWHCYQSMLFKHPCWCQRFSAVSSKLIHAEMIEIMDSPIAFQLLSSSGTCPGRGV